MLVATLDIKMQMYHVVGIVLLISGVNFHRYGEKTNIYEEIS